MCIFINTIQLMTLSNFTIPFSFPLHSSGSLFPSWLPGAFGVMFAKPFPEVSLYAIKLDSEFLLEYK